ncbi:MAG: M48 family peptidase [Planctomycetota bacterium]|nr:MAG: M48 family peptidase [Planctomycetota bacterium]
MLPPSEAELQRFQKQCPPRVHLRFNRNRQTLVSLRQSPTTRQWTLSLRPELLQYPGCEGDLLRFIAQNGNGDFPYLRQAVQDLFERLQHHQAQVIANVIDPKLSRLPTVGHEIHLHQRLKALQAQYWPELNPPHISWSRNPGPRPLRSIRFGCYRTSPTPRITIHPRLRQPWVADCFLNHVIHHELCHHAQHCIPQRRFRREPIHSPRFRQWEQSYEYYMQARQWERAYVPYLMDPNKPRPHRTPDQELV